MMAVQGKWTLSKELDRFRRELNQLLERLGSGHDFFSRRDEQAVGAATDSTGGLLELKGFLDVFDHRDVLLITNVEESRFTARVDVTGLDPSGVEFAVMGKILTIKTRRTDRNAPTKADFFIHSIPLPRQIEVEDLKVAYCDGVLEVSAPMLAQSICKAG